MVTYLWCPDHRYPDLPAASCAGRSVPLCWEAVFCSIRYWTWSMEAGRGTSADLHINTLFCQPWNVLWVLHRAGSTYFAKQCNMSSPVKSTICNFQVSQEDLKIESCHHGFYQVVPNRTGQRLAVAQVQCLKILEFSDGVWNFWDINVVLARILRFAGWAGNLLSSVQQLANFSDRSSFNSPIVSGNSERQCSTMNCSMDTNK